MRTNSYLDELIRVLENEKKVLRKSIKDCLAARDFKMASKYAKGLSQLTPRLEILYGFRDPNRRKMKVLSFRKKRLAAELKSYSNHARLLNFIQRELKEIDSQINKLTSAPVEPFEDTQHIDQALCDLNENLIKSFRLIFRDGNMQVSFQHNEAERLAIAVSPLEQLSESYLISKQSKKAMKHLGFVPDAAAGQYVYHVDLAAFTDTLLIKTLLARLVYDVFPQSYFGDTRTVELEINS
jgi:hypothetical protein